MVVQELCFLFCKKLRIVSDHFFEGADLRPIRQYKRIRFSVKITVETLEKEVRGSARKLFTEVGTAFPVSISIANSEIKETLMYVDTSHCNYLFYLKRKLYVE